MPTGTAGGVKFLNLDSNEVVVRDQFTIVKGDIPNEYMIKIRSICKYSKEQVLELLGPAEELDEDEDEDEEIIRQEEGVNTTPTPAPMAPTATVMTHLTNNEKMVDEAEEKEFMQYKAKEVLQGVLPDVAVNPDKMIGLKLFTKPKQDAAGTITSVKSRGVGFGNHQKTTIYERRGSPAASVQSLFTIATVAEYEGKLTCTYDVPGAYLNSLRQGRVPDVYIKLNRRQTQLMLKVNPS